MIIYLFLLLPFLTTQNTGFLIEQSNYYLLYNKYIRIKISKDDYTILSFCIYGKNVLKANAFFIEELVQDRMSCDHSSVVLFDHYPDSAGIEITKIHAGSIIKQYYQLDSLGLLWKVDYKHLKNDTNEVSFKFSIPISDMMEHIFYPANGAPEEIDNMTLHEFIYRQHLFIPMISFYSITRDYGLTLVVPFEVKKPSLSFSFHEKIIDVAFYHYCATKNRKINVALYFIPHKGDWRPGLYYLSQRYPEYFSSRVENISYNDGWYYLGHPYDDKNIIPLLRKRDVKWIELHGYFPFYGLYAPNTDEWNIYTNRENSNKKHSMNVNGLSSNSYAYMNELINAWRQQDIHVYLYYQCFEAWKDYAQSHFSGDIAIKQNGLSIPAFKSCYLLNPDPMNEWGIYIQRQLQKLLSCYPGINGIFYDRMDYMDYDFAHDDGITMVNGKPAYMLGFALEKINEYVLDIIHKEGKFIWGNGPTSIEVCKNIDGIMAEGNLKKLRKIQYLGLVRPIVYLPYDRTPKETEIKLKNALLCGAFPSITLGSIDCQQLERKYKPLFNLMQGRKWVLTENPVKCPKKLAYNVFKTPDGNYLVPIVDLAKSQLVPHIFEYNILIEFTVSDANEINNVYLLSSDWSGINELPFQKEKNKIYISIPCQLSTSLIYLTKKQQYPITRQSSPVLVKGSKHKLIFRVNDTNNKNALFEIVTPWFNGTEKVKGGRVTIETTIPDNITGETKFRVIYNSKEYLYSAWIVDPITMMFVENIFIKNQDGDTLQFYLVNNTSQQITLSCTGKFISGSGVIKTPPKISLNALETKLIRVSVKIPYDSQIMITLVNQNLTMNQVYSLETALSFGPNDLFHDDFKQGMKKWIIKYGVWNTTKGVAKAQGSKHLAVITNSTWNNYVFETKTRCLGSDNLKVSWLKVYLFFRFKDNNNFYRFGIHGDAGVVDLYVRLNGQWKKLGSSLFTPKKDEWYSLKIQAKGNHLSCYVNNRKVIEVNDNTFTNGGIGIGVLEDGMRCEYKDVVVRKL
ncbi:MAG: family 16 glycoside hydrolase [bacterium]